MTREERRAWITSRLHPIAGYDPSLANPLRSDFDLNPGLKVDNPHALRPAQDDPSIFQKVHDTWLRRDDDAFKRGGRGKGKLSRPSGD